MRVSLMGEASPDASGEEEETDEAGELLDPYEPAPGMSRRWMAIIMLVTGYEFSFCSLHHSNAETVQPRGHICVRPHDIPSCSTSCARPSQYTILHPVTGTAHAGATPY